MCCEELSQMIESLPLSEAVCHGQGVMWGCCGLTRSGGGGGVMVTPVVDGGVVKICFVLVGERGVVRCVGNLMEITRGRYARVRGVGYDWFIEFSIGRSIILNSKICT